MDDHGLEINGTPTPKKVEIIESKHVIIDEITHYLPVYLFNGESSYWYCGILCNSEKEALDELNANPNVVCARIISVSLPNFSTANLEMVKDLIDNRQKIKDEIIELEKIKRDKEKEIKCVGKKKKASRAETQATHASQDMYAAQEMAQGVEEWKSVEEGYED